MIVNNNKDRANDNDINNHNSNKTIININNIKTDTLNTAPITSRNEIKISANEKDENIWSKEITNYSITCNRNKSQFQGSRKCVVPENFFPQNRGIRNPGNPEKFF